MTARERILRMYHHQDADRIAIFDTPWQSTLRRWEKEGMPLDTDYTTYLGLDAIRTFRLDNSPQYEQKVLEETADYLIVTSTWGVTTKNWKHAESTPEFIDFTIKDPESWFTAKARITANSERINWKNIESDFSRWEKEGAWIQALLWFGFDITHSWIVGTERVLMALVENPEWLQDMFDTQLTVQLKLLDQLWDKSYRFQGVKWFDDMGYKKNQFFSLSMYREIIKPFHQRAIDWAHNKGIKTYLHSCGDINPFVPELVSMGLDMLNPLEVKAGSGAHPYCIDPPRWHLQDRKHQWK
ncbi:MAG: hypothetical protein A2293_03140 [Elusimicrobia bacterium RIFOXYB2_FULL_49_7]|nr:MAG: hypothetical protein A2293_03140 [Elusimicrobia bacterium RIFOXYB2_FULL_49_7]